MAAADTTAPDTTAVDTTAVDTSVPAGAPATEELSRWLPHGAPDGGRPFLLCFPHAGAGAGVFLPWRERLPVAVCPVQPPGRESRFAEPPHREAAPLVEAALAALAPVLGTAPFAIFGHSVGALVAYELTRALRRRGGPLPAHLVVSGRVAPQVRNPNSGLHDLPEPEFLRFIQSMGGIPERVLRGRAFAEMMVPLLRADVSVNETYEHEAEEPLPVPLTVLTGRDDARVPLRWVRPWEEHTSRGFTLRIVPGGHFFPFDPGTPVPGLIAGALGALGDRGREGAS